VRGMLPLRALPQTELLDTALVLFRARALPLLLIAAPLLAIEQYVLWWAGARWLDESASFADWWRTITALLGCDAVIIGLLGAYAGAAVTPALLGHKVTHRALLRRTRPLPVLVTMLVFALIALPGAYFGLAGWIVAYGFLGLFGVALVIDRPSWPLGALGRSAALASRLGWRGFGGRMRGFLLWFGIRVALAIGPVSFLWTAGLSPTAYLGDWPVLTVWGLAGTVSCAALACFDAVLLIDTRIRVEGLDIALRRAVANGADPASTLVHTRPRDAKAARISTMTPLQPWPADPARLPMPPGLNRQGQLQWLQARAQYLARQEQAQQQQARPERES
jgi:hypothetical protein